MTEIRQEKMAHLIQEREVITIKELRALFPEVSLMTIHRDLDTLAASGLITKMRGGARSVKHERESDFTIREKENVIGKSQVAEKALTLIQGKTSIFLDSGTTNLALARLLPDVPMTIATVGPNIALSLLRTSNPEITVCPGKLNRENLTVSGYSTTQFLETINIDLAFIGVSGYSKTTGFTCGQESEMMTKRLVIQRARKVALLCDKSKFKRLLPFTFAQIADVDYVICDQTLPDDFLQAAEAAGTIVL